MLFIERFNTDWLTIIESIISPHRCAPMLIFISIEFSISVPFNCEPCKYSCVFPFSSNFLHEAYILRSHYFYFSFICLLSLFLFSLCYCLHMLGVWVSRFRANTKEKSRMRVNTKFWFYPRLNVNIKWFICIAYVAKHNSSFSFCCCAKRLFALYLLTGFIFSCSFVFFIPYFFFFVCIFLFSNRKMPV